jgi:polyphosphate kinase 2 (PPK2 family)
VALPAPTEREKSQMYAQRYIRHLPAAGEIVIFDRSWYNRAGVERVMGFCTEEQARGFLKVVPMFEHLMIDSRIILLKYWLEVSAEEQTRRLESRIGDGRKTWKLSPMDVKSYDNGTTTRGRATRCSPRRTARGRPGTSRARKTSAGCAST